MARVRELCTCKPVCRKFTSAICHVFAAEDAQREHFLRCKLGTKVRAEIFPHRRRQYIVVVPLHRVVYQDDFALPQHRFIILRFRRPWHLRGLGFGQQRSTFLLYAVGDSHPLQRLRALLQNVRIGRMRARREERQGACDHLQTACPPRTTLVRPDRISFARAATCHTADNATRM